MKISIVAYNDVSEKTLSNAKRKFLSKFKDVKADDFVYSDPDVIWFLTGGSEHNALEQIEPQKRYCFIANQNDNSWAAATEVKALLNEKGIKTRIFNFDLIDSLEKIQLFLEEGKVFKKTKMAMIGKPESWLVASVPEYDLLEEVLGIEVVEYDWNSILDKEESENELFDSQFGACHYDSFPQNNTLYKKLKTFIADENVSALSFACFNFVQDNNYTACLPVATLNSENIPSTCEGDLCAAAGMIVLSRLVGKVPWMANLNYIDREHAIFTHCTVPVDIVSEFKVDTHYETDKGSAVNGKMNSGQVTVFRIDHQLEYCFLSLGEIVETGDLIKGCRTQIKVKLSRKSLFLLKEFPLGNHHLIIHGDYTDVLAEYFANRGFRIV